MRAARCSNRNRTRRFADGKECYRIQYLIEYLPLAFLLPAAVWDIRTSRIPNFLTLPLFALGLVFAAWRGGVGHSLLGALYALAMVLILAGLGMGMGGGDIKLAAACGAWLGPAPAGYFVFGVIFFNAVCTTVLSVKQNGVKGFFGRLWMETREFIYTRKSSLVPIRVPGAPLMLAAYALVAVFAGHWS